MARKRSPTDTIEQIQIALEAWKQINPELQIGTLSQTDLETQLTESRQLSVQFDALEVQLTHLRNQRDQVLWDSWQMLKRFRNGVKAIYGDDSSEYEMVGGTRMSERKSPKRSKV